MDVKCQWLLLSRDYLLMERKVTSEAPGAPPVEEAGALSPFCNPAPPEITSFLLLPQAILKGQHFLEFKVMLPPRVSPVSHTSWLHPLKCHSDSPHPLQPPVPLPLSRVPLTAWSSQCGCSETPAYAVSPHTPSLAKFYGLCLDPSSCYLYCHSSDSGSCLLSGRWQWFSQALWNVNFPN